MCGRYYHSQFVPKSINQMSPFSGPDIQPLSAYVVISYLNKQVDRLFLCTALFLLPHSNGFWVKWTMWVNGKTKSILGFRILVKYQALIPSYHFSQSGFLNTGPLWKGKCTHYHITSGMTHISSETSVYHSEADRRCHLVSLPTVKYMEQSRGFSEGKGIGSNAWICLRRKQRRWFLPWSVIKNKVLGESLSPCSLSPH